MFVDHLLLLIIINLQSDILAVNIKQKQLVNKSNIDKKLIKNNKKITSVSIKVNQLAIKIIMDIRTKSTHKNRTRSGFK